MLQHAERRSQNRQAYGFKYIVLQGVILIVRTQGRRIAFAMLRVPEPQKAHIEILYGFVLT
jgi:hypothetical protein